MCMTNTMVANDLAMQGAKATAAMLLTYVYHDTLG